jgi:hypothetical protein
MRMGRNSVYAAPRTAKQGDESDPRQQAVFDRVLLPIYDIVLHLCPLYTDRLIDSRAKFVVVVRTIGPALA